MFGVPWPPAEAPVAEAWLPAVAGGAGLGGAGVPGVAVCRAVVGEGGRDVTVLRDPGPGVTVLWLALPASPAPPLSRGAGCGASNSVAGRGGVPDRTVSAVGDVPPGRTGAPGFAALPGAGCGAPRRAAAAGADGAGPGLATPAGVGRGFAAPPAAGCDVGEPTAGCDVGELAVCCEDGELAACCGECELAVGFGEGEPAVCCAELDGVVAAGVRGVPAFGPVADPSAGASAGGLAPDGGWFSAGARLDAGGPGLGRFRLGDGRRASERLLFGALISGSRGVSR